ncbi:fimbrillin family protein [Bacteroides thetaiotaomicron]|nr:fimbrillin family protein [Bacteroides thetaiotaomicron]
MKKSLLHVAFAALLLVGCAQNEITDISPDAAPPVGFKVFTDAQTRGLITNGGASSVNATGIQTTGFGVFAYYTGQSTWASAAANTAPNFMYNQKVAYSASEWGYTPVKYWPNTEGDKIRLLRLCASQHHDKKRHRHHPHHDKYKGGTHHAFHVADRTCRHGGPRGNQCHTDR